MRKCVTYILFLCILTGVQSCDFLRRMASRPTSSDIAAIRERIVADSLAKKALEDSLERERLRVEAYLADSVAVRAAIDGENIYLGVPSQQPKADVSGLSARYWIVTGVFSVESHAERLAKSIEEFGFSTCIIPYGKNAMVLAAPNSRLRGVYDDFKKLSVSSQKIPGIWIFDTAPVSVE